MAATAKVYRLRTLAQRSGAHELFKNAKLASMGMTMGEAQQRTGLRLPREQRRQIFALRRAGAGPGAANSTPSAIRSMNSSSGSLVMVPPLLKLCSRPRQQSFDRFFRLARLEGHFTSGSLLPVAPYQRQAVWFGKTAQHPQGDLSHLFLLHELRKLGERCEHGRILIDVID